MISGIYARVGIQSKNGRDYEKTLMEILGYYNLTITELIKKNRKNEIVTARMVCMCALYYEHRWTLQTVGKFFYRHHTTVMHAIERVRNLIDTEPDFKDSVLRLSPKVIELIHKKVEVNQR
jgi:chromosomal replication initiation ATPase DnaA